MIEWVCLDRRVAVLPERFYSHEPCPRSHKLSLACVPSTMLPRRALLRMDVVGITEDMRGFESALFARWPDTFGRPGCHIPSGSDARNPTSRHVMRGNASTSLDNVTSDAIRSLNQLDLALYDLARRVARAQRECISRLPTKTEEARSNGRATRRCFEAVRERFVKSTTMMTSAQLKQHVGDVFARARDAAQYE